MAQILTICMRQVRFWEKPRKPKFRVWPFGFGSVRVFKNRNRTEIRFPHIPTLKCKICVRSQHWTLQLKPAGTKAMTTTSSSRNWMATTHGQRAARQSASCSVNGLTHCGRGLPVASQASNTRSCVLYGTSLSGWTLIVGGTASPDVPRVCARQQQDSTTCYIDVNTKSDNAPSFPRKACPRDDAQGYVSASEWETYPCASSRGNASRGKDRRVSGPQPIKHLYKASHMPTAVYSHQQLCGDHAGYYRSQNSRCSWFVH